MNDVPTIGYPPGERPPGRATMTPEPREFLPGWMAERRWFRGDGPSSLRRVSGFRWEDPAGEVGIDHHLVQARGEGSPPVYYVPLTYRDAPLEGADEAALITRARHSQLGERWVYDAVHDPVFVAEALRQASPGEELTLLSTSVLTAEQSNTSLLARVQRPDGTTLELMLKVFRVLTPGQNPDVELTRALTQVGCPTVPGFAGHLTAQWDDGEADSIIVQEFLSGATEAWQVFTQAAAHGEPLLEQAELLGEAVARTHQALQAAVPYQGSIRDAAVRALSAGETWWARWVTAVEAHPPLEAYTRQAEAIFHRALDATPWPPFQRIHGDLHLGQILQAPGRGWVLLDFEGEPLRPLEERVQPDQPLRDVAGMLRSFDYSAGQPGSQASHEWAAEHCARFLQGYTRELGQPLSSAPLLDAFELDKAAYEVAYEATHRPQWLHLPVAAITRLCSHST